MTERGASNPPFPTSVREGETVAGKYVVGPLISIGGMGAVFEAHDKLLERRVALKVLLPQLLPSATASQRFLREARAATRITSEHVVKLLDTQLLPDGSPLLVMEYLEGKDLRALLRDHGPLEPTLAVDYVLQALQAVAEGHLQAIIHRDLKPSNLFLTERADGTAQIKVLDFGIAKTQPRTPEDFSLTSSEDVRLGSPTYMPPEQFQNPRDVDARADIWALGVTLYELMTGRVPFQGASYGELVSQVLNGSTQLLKAALSQTPLPAGLAEIVLKCLEKDRERRYANAVELAVALAPFGSDDARLSLTRVSGLGRARSPNPTGAARDSIGSYEATLPVSSDAAPLPPNTTSGTSRTRAWALSNRTPLLFGGSVAALLALGVVWQGHLLRSAPPPSAIATSFSAARPQAPATGIAPLGSASASPALLEPKPSDPAAALSKPASASTKPVARFPSASPALPVSKPSEPQPARGDPAEPADPTLERVKALVERGDRRASPSPGSEAPGNR